MSPDCVKSPGQALVEAIRTIPGHEHLLFHALGRKWIFGGELPLAEACDPLGAAPPAALMR